MSSDLERRYRRVLRLLPGWYRQQWEQDMVAAFLDSWLTGDPEADEYISKVAGPSWAEVASVAVLAVRLHLAGPGTPRRYAWGQAIRRAVLAVVLVHALLAVNVLVFLVWSRRLVGWLPAPPASLVVAPGGVWDMVYYLVCLAWIVIFLTLALGHYRTARVLAALAIVPGLVALLQAQLTGIMPAPFGPWIFWVLLDSCPGPGHDRVPPRRPADRAPALAAGPARRLRPGVRAAAGAPGDRQLRLAAGLLRAVLHPGQPCLPGARTQGPVPPGCRPGAVVADPGPAGCRRRGVPDRHAHRLPARPAPDQREPGRTAHRAGRRRAGRPRRRPRPGSHARTAAPLPTPWLPREDPGHAMPAPAPPAVRPGQRAGRRRASCSPWSAAATSPR